MDFYSLAFITSAFIILLFLITAQLSPSMNFSNCLIHHFKEAIKKKVTEMTELQSYKVVHIFVLFNYKIF